MKNKNSLRIISYLLISLIVVLLLGAGGVYLWTKHILTTPVSGTSEKIEFIIAPGATTTMVAKQLMADNLIRSDLMFGLYARYKGLDKKIQAGIYYLDPSLNLMQIIGKLQNNPSGIAVTTLEGWRREQIATALETAFEGNNPNYSVGEFMTLTQKMEGALFPDTYQFEVFASTEKIVKVMHDRYLEIVQQMKSQGQAQAYNEYQLTTVASLLEREAKTESDRQIVAGILFNRLEAGMPLQIDATLQYVKATRICPVVDGCENWWPSPSSEDKELVSPYNTYLNVGLTPAPIANPGKDTLLAAHNPIKSENYYYLTDNNGITHFAKTYDQHLVNINTYLK